MFDPSVGRWIEHKDPSFESNLYRYAGNDPVNYTDPSGLSRMDVVDLADGKQSLYYVHTNWFGRAAYYTSSLGLGWLINQAEDQDMFEAPPVLIGQYDPLTGNVQRGNEFVAVERVKNEAESSFGGRPDWDAFFRDNAIDFNARRQAQGLAWREMLGIQFENAAVSARGQLQGLAVDVGMAAIPALSGLRLARLASIRRLGGPASTATLRAAVSEVIRERRSFGIASGLRTSGLREATHQQMERAFFASGFTPSNHFITRAKDIRTYNCGVRTFEDIERIIRHGELVSAEEGAKAFVLDGMAIVFNPDSGILITLRPW
jgi:hypothetical protein